MSDDALAIAGAVRAGRVRARDVAADALERIGKRDGAINSFTAVTADSALRDAERIDAAVAAGMDAGLLAGVPFAVKNLFDVAGIVTLAGSRINADRPPAVRDAVIVAALRRAGAVLVGALNMDEYAYGFTTENSHYGPTRNPHDPLRVAGGSSGGSGAAVAAGLVPIALGSDTNGSIRVPSALCGVFGLKPTYGRVSRTGAALFSTSLDHVGPLARSLRDTAAAFDVIQGPDAADPVSSSRTPEPCLPHLDDGIAGIRIAVAGGYFARGGEPEAFDGVEAAAAALGVTRRVEIPEAHRARAAAMTITAAEGAHLHAADLRSRAGDFDPRTRGRFLAGALIPAAYYLQAQRFRTWYRDQVRALFREVDVILAPTTPWAATRIGEDTLTIGGEEIPIRPSFGLYTQPISFIGLPVLAAPIARPGALPRGIQIIGAPFTEALLFRVAAALEGMGVVGATLAEVPTVQA